MPTCRRSSTFVVAGQEGMILCLRKALYGLRQALRAWNTKLDGTLREIGFQQSAHEAAVYRRGSCCSLLLVAVYVDDLVIADADEDEVEAFKVQMKAVFQMSDLGLLCFTSTSRFIKTAPTSPIAKPPTPSTLLSWAGSSTATQPTLLQRRG